MIETPIKTLGEILTEVAKQVVPSEVVIQDKTETGWVARSARYMVFELMEKAGYTHQEIADFFKMNRENVTKGLTRLDGWKKAYQDVRDTCGRLERTVLGA